MKKVGKNWIEWKVEVLIILFKEEENEDDNDSDVEMFQHTGNYLTKSQFLQLGTIEIKKCTDANKEAPHQVSFNNFIRFHDFELRY